MPAVLTATFTRLPIPGGDNNNYDTYVMQQIRRGSIGSNNIDVSNSGGSLNVGLGFAGINDGVTEGAIQVTVPGSQTLAGSTPGLWHALEFSVSGTAATFYLTALITESNEAFMSLLIKGYYDATKGGYYRIASRRVLAFVFIRAGTVLGRIVNTENGVKGFKGITLTDYIDSSGSRTQKYIATMIQEIGNWNMQASAGGSATLTLTLNVPIYVFRKIRVIINDDTLSAFSNLEYADNSTGKSNGAVQGIGSSGILNLTRLTGGIYDSVGFHTSPLNRGVVTIEWET
jgi:hypothetical protein